MTSSRNVWNAESSTDLESWLKSNRPSHFSHIDYAWIQIENTNPISPGYSSTHHDSLLSFDRKAYRPALEKIENLVKGGKRVSSIIKQSCVHTIQKIAQQQKCTVGKWMLFLKPQDADEQWEKIARATAQGELGCSAKINPTKDRVQDVVCCIYTSNFADKADVQRVLFALENMGFGIKCGYKPDFYTYLDIYANNQWRLSPTLYSVKEARNWKCKEGSQQVLPFLPSTG